MAASSLRGKFITFEGPEGSGKSTQAKSLVRYLRKKGIKVIFLREPGGSKVGEKIRRVLLDRRNTNISAVTETLLYLAARAQLVEEVILPALKDGCTVICDRFMDSTLVYQGYALGVDMGFIQEINNFILRGLKIDLTILLDLPVKKGLRHRRGRRDRIEARPLSYHRRVREGYLFLARNNPARIKIIKVEDRPLLTQEKIRKLVDKYVFS